ncbi:MAG: hypothetical protein CMM84_18800 [Rhodothermaceae bacterium]|nr:hypothetical protein [Rhodothermaceae bacterium]MBC13325.1 hypothetical protein [Rhodothermaceae bacterium]MBC13375.1 hypothetical protein [Rhodothermaceae bacterium]MBC15077.1 hypothetical protein [Rhodothermaceae bacterium]MBC15390.1 hypothetical protein [Rhodothermaceae bacterium]
MTKGELEQHFTVLEIEPGASPQEIKRAWRTLAKVWHPDRFAGDPGLQARATAKLKLVNEAYRVLSEHSASRQSQPKSPPPAPEPAPPPKPPRPPAGSANRTAPSPPTRVRTTVWGVAALGVIAWAGATLFFSDGGEPSAATSPSVRTQEVFVAPAPTGTLAVSDIADVWLGRLGRADESWRVELDLRADGPSVRGTSRKTAGDREVEWAVRGDLSGPGLYLSELEVLDDRRAPEDTGAWCRRAGHLSLSPDGRTLAGTMEAPGGRCPSAQLVVSRVDQPAASLADADVAGRWEGAYECYQGATRLVLDIQPQGGGRLGATFAFGAHPESPSDIPDGAYTMTGSYDQASAHVELDGRSWIEHPEPYVMVGLSGTVQVNGTELQMVGAVVGEGCTTFRLRKAAG